MKSCYMLHTGEPSGRYAKWISSVMEGQIGFHFFEVPRVEKCLKAESRMISTYQECVGSGSVRNLESPLEMDGGDSCTANVNVLNATEPCMEKWWGL